jgi:quinol monooxygenase YgiN
MYSDVLRDQEVPNRFIFYELYKDVSAVDYHKTQPHYLAWASFKESGGVIKSVSKKNDGEFVEL